jgi:V/A-type H+-transporting ATPase subunit A
LRDTALRILQQEAELEEIVRLVGPEALPEDDKLMLLASKIIREDFLMQSAYHPVDTYTTPKRAHTMLSTIIKFYELAKGMAEGGTSVAEIAALPVIAKISRMKDIPNEEFDTYIGELLEDFESAAPGEGLK